MKKLLPSILLAAALVVDVSIMPLLARGDLVPIFALVVVNCYGLLLGRTRGLWYALVAGLVLDINVGSPLGLMTLSMAFVGYLGGVLSRAFPRSYLTPALSGALGRLAVELVLAVYLIWETASVGAAMASGALIRTAIDAALVTAFYWLLNWLIRPARSRFAPR
ncbi:MAG: rod shape-determining protein MreD [Clostridiales bacterium]|nr:rod shape-determining protein MreD [Clostridiales bacterium]